MLPKVEDTHSRHFFVDVPCKVLQDFVSLKKVGLDFKHQKEVRFHMERRPSVIEYDRIHIEAYLVVT